ncbi:MAG TPA: HAMP domain-containing sensor histidine kinase, partial [Anaerolineaceae bacterium]|nr:HAMP domain-containing sensor histidine kinase [Anaerolineaceae bacterium]
PADGRVTLTLGKNDTQAIFTVADTGPGISAEDLPHIFERFYRAERSRKRQRGSGFGLGLSIAYWIVRSHGGDIAVHSVEGKGTKFEVNLPLTGPGEPKKELEPSAKAPGR